MLTKHYLWLYFVCFFLLLIKNNLTIARGEWGWDSEERGLQNYYKGHMEKIKGEGRDGGGMGVWLGWGGGM